MQALFLNFFEILIGTSNSFSAARVSFEAQQGFNIAGFSAPSSSIQHFFELFHDFSLKENLSPPPYDCPQAAERVKFFKIFCTAFAIAVQNEYN